ncbi:MAG: GNAT family N-acetyltransferase, partial [Telluria sp.]
RIRATGDVGITLADISIRAAQPEDIDAIWEIFQVHLAAGETYPFDAHTPRSVCEDYWLGPNVSSHVAVDPKGRVLGMYRILPNQPGRGAHVANASYMVGQTAQGRGIGFLMGQHSLAEARRLGYLAMQFNYVVSTNQPAVALWRKLGFSVAGTLPKAYLHERLGYVDALVMYQLLSDPETWPGRI